MPSAFAAGRSWRPRRAIGEKPGAQNKSTQLAGAVMRSFRVAACFKTKLLPRQFRVFSIGTGSMHFTNVGLITEEERVFATGIKVWEQRPYFESDSQAQSFFKIAVKTPRKICVMGKERGKRS